VALSLIQRHQFTRTESYWSISAVCALLWPAKACPWQSEGS